jgi:hypothetical protein
MSAKPRNVWQVMLGLIRIQAGLYTVNLILWGLVFTTPLLGGLIARYFFDTLEKRPLELNISSLIALVQPLCPHSRASRSKGAQHQRWRSHFNF